MKSVGRSLPPLLRGFLFGSIVLVAVCGVTEVVCRLVLHLHYPFDFPIMNPGGITMDLLAMHDHFVYIHTKMFFDVPSDIEFLYPAPVAIPYWIFLYNFRFARAVFYLFSLAGVAIAATPLGKSMVRRGVSRKDTVVFLVFSFFCSMPFWFEFKQGNMEIVVFFFIAAAVTMFMHGNDWSAATLLGVAGAMKYFPFILVALFITQRKYLKAAYAFLVGAVVTVASLWFIYPPIVFTWTRLNASFSGFLNTYLLHFLFPEESRFDHSGFAFIKRFLPHTWGVEQMQRILHGYLLVGALIGAVLYVWKIRRLPVVNQVLCLVIAIILFTPMSFDYTLIELYTPWALLLLLAIDSRRSGHIVPGLSAAFLCLTILCSPISELIVHGATIQAPIKTLLLVALFVIGLRFPFASPIPSSFEVRAVNNSFDRADGHQGMLG